MLFSYVCVTLLLALTVVPLSAASCRTHDDKLGSCVKNDLTRYCPHFIPMIQKHGYGIIRLCSTPGELCCPPKPQQRCNQREFRCDNGECVAQWMKCNGRVDCSDGSDEKRFLCPAPTTVRPEVCLLKDGSRGTCVTNDLARTCPHLPELVRQKGYGILSLCGPRHGKICCPDKLPSSTISVGPTTPLIPCGTSRYGSITRHRFKRNSRCQGSDGTSEIGAVVHIVGGDELAPNSQPWAALLGVKRSKYRVEWKCGGVLISDRHIVTAAHCFIYNSNPEEWIVRLGEHNIRDFRESNHKDYVPKSLSANGFDGRALYNDIAVVTLPSSVQFTDTINRACLPDRPLVRRGEGLVIGWGDVEFGGCPSNVLLGVNLTVLNQQVCQSSYQQIWPGFLQRSRIPNGFTNDLFCAANEAGNKDACQGDSGSPFLKLNNERRYVAVGIVSSGQGCAAKGNPGIYTDIYSHLDWIKQTMNSNQ